MMKDYLCSLGDFEPLILEGYKDADDAAYAYADEICLRWGTYLDEDQMSDIVCDEITLEVES